MAAEIAETARPLESKIGHQGTKSTVRLRSPQAPALSGVEGWPSCLSRLTFQFDAGSAPIDAFVTNVAPGSSGPDTSSVHSSSDRPVRMTMGVNSVPSYAHTRALLPVL